ncbi:hypothetical protein EJ05DRAFT_130111 [Pseudovirgaria hyperparasitica]|uniref:ATP-dependent DNA ligase family profile domain-containing protein n=1 Tax=Pseudovirgaria hyperparasitica TaxID=470096 RepID=A0A6A6VXZ9_9PEZI|nr:uncharacterized protein EJ05DRAFT_130111 [Pseudovirgaria hyperparasitica]KAF2754686.1 hypothetical protein EJ05DRAFT_130111 [Pseudovirgaria hyperparasitica]
MKFSIITELLESLERFETHPKPVSKSEKERSKRVAFESWFRKYQTELSPHEIDLGAILSTLLPHKRSDRVYAIQQETLVRLVPRIFGFGVANTRSLQSFREPGKGDLGNSVQRVLAQFDSSSRPGSGPLMLREVDKALTEIASQQPHSSPRIRALALEESQRRDRQTILNPLFKKAYSKDAKWLVRLILKDFSPVLMDEPLILKCFHFLLPGLMKFQDDLLEATRFLKESLGHVPACPSDRERKSIMQIVDRQLQPVLGVKVGRPNFHKARSVKHCLQLARGHKWVVERKYDGEYCEIHVDLATKENMIQIFSKSGKDSTKDRHKLHATIMESLQIGTQRCAFQQRCIVLGEMVVYDDREDRIADFDKIRKHIRRSGRLIGTSADSQCHPWEHLKIVYFDVLVIDDNFTLSLPYLERRRILSTMVKLRHGRAARAERVTVDFSDPCAERRVLEHFAIARYRGHEGLILKPADAPYISLGRSSHGGETNATSPRYFIKMKADYMEELGGGRDVADFAIIGARYNPQQAQKSSMRNLRWTTFYLGCLVNTKSVLQCNSKPRYRIVGMISQDHCIPDAVLKSINIHGSFVADEFTQTHFKSESPFEIEYIHNSNLLPMSHYFKEPMVVEVLGSGFVKMPNESIYMLRHPRMLKHHLDRSWEDTVSLDDLQTMAEEAHSLPIPSQEEINKTSQRYRDLINAIKAKESQRTNDSLKIAQETTPRSIESVMSTPMIARTRRSPRSGRTQPLLVRIDTGDRVQPIEAFASSYSTTDMPELGIARLGPTDNTNSSALREINIHSSSITLNTVAKDAIPSSRFTNYDSLPTPPSTEEALRKVSDMPQCGKTSTAVVELPLVKAEEVVSQPPQQSYKKKRSRSRQGIFDPAPVHAWLDARSPGECCSSALPKRRKHSAPTTPDPSRCPATISSGEAAQVVAGPPSELRSVKGFGARPALISATSMPAPARELEIVHLRRTLSYHIEESARALKKLQALESDSET